MEKKIVKQAVKKVEITKVGTADTIAERYVALRAAIAEMENELDAVKDEAKALMRNGVLETSSGTFKIVTRKSYDWSLDTLKMIMPRLWQAFVKPDSSTLRKRMETTDQIGAELTATADVKVSEALTFTEKK